MNSLFEFGDDTASQQTSYANAKNMSYVGSAPDTKKADRDSDSWYTPELYIESARLALGSIDLDPFSSAKANEVVKATRYHTEQDSCLHVDWPADNVWMNPPYGKLCTQACDKFIEQFTAGNFRQGIILVNNSTDTKWFARLAQHASAYCFTDHRIKFTVADNKASSGNTRGQIFIYFGPNTAKFKQEFTKHGLVLGKL